MIKIIILTHFPKFDQNFSAVLCIFVVFNNFTNCLFGMALPCRNKLALMVPGLFCLEYDSAYIRTSLVIHTFCSMFTKSLVVIQFHCELCYIVWIGCFLCSYLKS